jgi:hypothetical protein
VGFSEIVELHPQPSSLDREALLRCVDECCIPPCLDCGRGWDISPFVVEFAA